MSPPRSFVDSSHIGVVILSAFSLVWAAAAIGLSSLRLESMLVAGLILVTAIIINITAAWRDFDPVDEAESPIPAHRRRRIFIAANIGQAVAFSVLISVCIALNELAYIPLVGSLIVGAHLIPIGLSFAEISFTAGGGFLILTGAAGTAVALTSLVSPAVATGVVSLLNAAVLVSLAGLQTYRYSNRRQ